MFFPKFVYMTKNTPFFAPLNDVRSYSAWSWKTTLITWIFGRAWYPPWHSSGPPGKIHPFIYQIWLFISSHSYYQEADFATHASGMYSNYFLTGCGARVLKPIPIFLPQKRLIFTVFSPKFLQIGLISKGFSTTQMLDFTIFRNFCEMGPSSKDFFGQNGTHV